MVKEQVFTEAVDEAQRCSCTVTGKPGALMEQEGSWKGRGRVWELETGAAFPVLKFLVQVSSNFKFFLFLFSGSLFIYHLSFFAALEVFTAAHRPSPAVLSRALLFTVVHGLLLTAAFPAVGHRL